MLRHWFSFFGSLQLLGRSAQRAQEAEAERGRTRRRRWRRRRKWRRRHEEEIDEDAGATPPEDPESREPD